MKIIPKLGLDRITDPALGEYAQDKIEKINAAPAFAAVVPSSAEVDAKNIEWRAALVKADDGNKADTANKNRVRGELEAMLTAQAYNCALTANGDMVKYLTSGYQARDTQGHPIGILGQVSGLELDFGDNEGEDGEEMLFEDGEVMEYES